MLQFEAKNLILVQQEIDRIDKIIENLEEFYRGPASRVLRMFSWKFFGAKELQQKHKVGLH